MGTTLTESQADFEVHPIRVEFRSAETERKFQRHHLVRSQEVFAHYAGFLFFLYVTFAATDVGVLGYTHDALLLFLARMLVAVTAMLGLYLIRSYPQSIMICPVTATVVEVVGMGTFILIVRHRPNEIPWHAMSVCIMLIVVYIFIPNRLVISQGIAAFTTAAFIAIVISMGTLKRADILTMSMLLLLTNSFGLVAARRYHRLWREEYRVQSLLTHQAMRDHLTGCYNRRHLHDVLLTSEIKRGRLHRLSFSVILCDIDHFKSINDTYGHLCGDAVIRQFATLLRALTRQHVDSVVRYGGEEFLLLLPQTDQAGAEILAERLRGSFAETPADYAGQRIATTASFGVLAVNLADGEKDVSEEAIIAAVDELLYRSKNAGRNNVQSGDFP